MIGERITYIDSLKGFLILLVIVGHIGYANYPDTTIVYDVIYSFHMPLFVFVSGFLMNSITPTKLLHKLPSLLFPFIIVGTLFSLYRGSGFYDWLLSANKNYFWYLLVLFYCYVIICCVYWMQARIHVKKQSVIIVWGGVFYVVLLIINRFLPIKINDILSFHVLCVYYPFFLLGHLFRVHKLFQRIINNDWVIMLSILLYLPALYFFRLVGNPLLHAGAALCAIVVIVNFFQSVDLRQIGKGLSSLGQRTLDIYIYHGFILCLFNLDFLCKWVNLTSNYIIEFILEVIVAVIVALISILIGRFIKTSTVLSRIVYGRF